MSENYNTPGGGQVPRPGPDQGWNSGGPVPPNAQVSAQEVLSHRDGPRVNTRRRVVVVVAALVATVGAVVGGVALTSSSAPTGTAAGARSNANIDPPPTVVPTVALSVPAVPTLGSAAAVASAMAAQGTFSPPVAVPGDVPTSDTDLQSDVVLPADLAVTVPSVSAKDPNAQALADQTARFLRSWIAAWASGNVNDARYDAWCVDGCRAFMDRNITDWSRARITPVGTLTFSNLAGGTANGGASGEVGVCLDDSRLYAKTVSGQLGLNPYPAGMVLYVFGLVYDKAVNHWVVTEGYTSPGDSYCAPAS